MADGPNAQRLGILYMTLASVAWSTGGIFARWSAHIDLTTTMFWRNLASLVGLLVVLLLLQGPAGLAVFRRMNRPWLLTSAMGGMAAFVTVPALGLTSVSHVVVIYATTPFLAAGIAWVALGQRPSRADIIASTLALAGAVYMIGFGAEGGLLGDALALVLALTMSGVIVMARHHPELPSLHVALTAFAFAVAGSLLLAQDLAVPLAALPILAGYGLINSALGTLFFLLGSRLLRPVETALLGALETPLGPLWVWLILSETPGPAALIGGSVVMVAVVWHTLRSNAPT